MVEQSPREHRDTDMRCLPSLLIKRNRAWLDRLKPVETLILGARATKAHKGEIQRCRSLISQMVVAAMRIGLPDLDQPIGNRQPIAIEDVSFDANALADRLRLNQHMANCILAQQGMRKERPDRLRTAQKGFVHG